MFNFRANLKGHLMEISNEQVPFRLYAHIQSIVVPFSLVYPGITDEWRLYGY